jgi:hypothetical protein
MLKGNGSEQPAEAPAKAAEAPKAERKQRTDPPEPRRAERKQTHPGERPLQQEDPQT